MRGQDSFSQEPPLVTWAITAAILAVVMATFLVLNYAGVNVLALLA